MGSDFRHKFASEIGSSDYGIVPYSDVPYSDVHCIRTFNVIPWVFFRGSYSDSAGIEIIRRHVAEYIELRDGGIKSDWENIILCAGASESIRVI